MIETAAYRLAVEGSYAVLRSRGGGQTTRLSLLAPLLTGFFPSGTDATNDWAIPDKQTWREYVEVKPELGVPSRYYAAHLHVGGEALDEDDYAAVRRTWAAWRAG